MVLFLLTVAFTFGRMETLSQYPYVDMFLLYMGLPVFVHLTVSMWDGRVYLCTCLCICLCTSACVCVCMCVCVCVLGSSDISVSGESPYSDPY